MNDTPWPDDTALRRARVSDVDAILELKADLSLSREDSGDRGGFLLGRSRDEYERMCRADQVLVLEVDGEFAGMAASLDDPAFRQSDLWERKNRVDWGGFSPEAIVDSNRIAYFDQLAVSPRYQGEYFGAVLALASVEQLFEEGHDFVVATTVVEPVTNRAALPLMDKVRARAIGTLEETYPEVGAITSRLHIIERATCRAALDELRESGTEIERATIEGVRAALRGGL